MRPSHLCQQPVATLAAAASALCVFLQASTMQTSIMHTSTLAGRALAPVQNRSRAQVRLPRTYLSYIARNCKQHGISIAVVGWC